VISPKCDTHLQFVCRNAVAGSQPFCLSSKSCFVSQIKLKIQQILCFMLNKVCGAYQLQALALVLQAQAIHRCLPNFPLRGATVCAKIDDAPWAVITVNKHSFNFPFSRTASKMQRERGGGGVVHITRTASLCILERKLLPSEGVRPESLDNVDCDGFIKGQFSRMSSCCVVNSKKLETNIFPNISKFCLSHRTTCLWLELLSTLILVDDLYL